MTGKLKISKKLEKEIAQRIIKEIKENGLTKSKLSALKKRIGKEYGLKDVFPNTRIVEHASKEDRELIINTVMRKPVRSISGVSIVAVMIPIKSCPGKCIYCPTGMNAPKSYTGKEPAARRAKMFGFDPYRQVKERLRQLELIGHPTDKIELIIMGGTFPSEDPDFQRNFVKRMFDALNEDDSASLKDALKKNEKAKHRCVGLTIETRPDFCGEKEINLMLEMGCTRVELGVQSLDDDVLEKVQRGHSVKETIKAFKLLKDSGLKIVAHMMPGLFHNKKQDLEMFDELFNNENFKPDMIKMYPALVIKGTGLYSLYRKGLFTPLDNKSASELLAEIKSKVPRFIRIMRIQRDIPSTEIEVGIKASNLRELVQKEMNSKGLKCNCIRCREAGHNFYKNKIIPKNIKKRVEEYKASGGEEFFISYEDFERDILIGYIRLRFPDKPFRKELKGSAVVRELRVVGSEVPIDENAVGQQHQHKGYGKELLKEAEEIAIKRGYRKLAVISAIGTREYYRKFGYRLEGVYMVKNLK